MKSIIRILNLAITKEYYRQNVIFIFAIMMFSFGFLRANEHITIIKLVLKLPSLLLLTFLVWALHTVKITLFTLRMFESKNNEFLYHISLFPKLKRWTAFAALQFNLVQLTFLYSLWMLKIALEEKQFGAFFLIIAYHIIFIVAGIAAYEYRLQRPNATQVIKQPIQNLLGKFTTPHFLFYIRYLFAKQPVLLLLGKLFSCFMLAGVCNLYPTDAYDERLLALGGLFSAAGHSIFTQEFIYFEHQFLSFSRNLPIKTFQRFLNYSITYSIILIPELIVLLRNLPQGISVIFIFSLMTFILSMILLNHQTQYINKINNDTYLQRLFFVGILFLLLIMFKIPVILMASVNILLAGFVLNKHFYESQMLD
ncbi:hypothetical protein Emtol_3424 [Emticicia oligotrophica DSM 17448]|uniref:Uncharacterized protein n=1 Tax=Emticicia oligotrophica (strain DSM 17448 / CIP 109782 / MTCC 6937 / GPTSA100-15) TaxID=929562 RepID=A0ABM5N4Z7_EMTOG|nr:MULTISPECIES: hypothetical protein [Emticicia]AFK04553.1 hypothetical protein Emtol_3424 [Emticicia oligotrophica DSM 17448]